MRAYRTLCAAVLAFACGQAAAFFDEQSEFLHPDDAFQLALAADASGTAIARFIVAEGYYLYRGKMSFVADGGIEYNLPIGKNKEDPLFGLVQVYDSDVLITLRELVGSAATITAKYQGCAEAGVCYPIQTKSFTISWDGVVAAPVPASELSVADQIAADLSTRSIWLSFLVFIGFGLLLALTPCVLPLVPILAGVIAGDEHPGTGRAFRLSLAYVLSLAAVYALMGLIVGMTGANIQPYLQNIYIIGAFALLLLILALSMFGHFELRMPHAVEQWLHTTHHGIPGGRYTGAVAMGALGALIATPCVSPALVGALIYIADAGEAARGAVSLFGMGLGLGLPLLALGTLEGRLLPQAGPWMTMMRAVFGWLLLALAVWMLDRVVPDRVTLILTGVLLVSLAVWLRAIDSLPADARHSTRVGKGIGLVVLIYGAVLLSGGAMGGSKLLAPWDTPGRMLTQGGAVEDRKAFGGTAVKTMADLERELAAATPRPAVVYYTAEWCVVCAELDAFTFPDADVQAALSGTARIMIDVTANNADDQALLKRYGLFGPPAILFFDATGQEVRALRVSGYVNPRNLLTALGRLDPKLTAR